MIEEKNRYKIPLVVGMICFITCNFVYDFTSINGFYYIGSAIAFFMYSVSLYLLRKGVLTEILITLTLGQLLDEILGQAESYSLYEYIPIIVYVLYKIKKWKTHPNT